MATPTGAATPPAVPPPLLQGAGTPLPSQIPSRSAPGQNTGVGTFGVKSGLAQMLKGGVIVEVVSQEQAKLAEEAGACAVIVVERLPADIRVSGGVARMCDPAKIKSIQDAVNVPVMAKVRVGHFVEAQILQSLGVDYIDESETLTAADEQYHINKHAFKVPFACGVRGLGDVLRRVSEGAAFVHTLGDAGSGNVAQGVAHLREILAAVRRAATMNDEELFAYAASMRAPLQLLKETARLKRLPVVNFAAGGIATPADAALLMQLGADGVVVGSGIFHSESPAKLAKAIVQAVTHFNNPKILAEVSLNLGTTMHGVGQ